MHLFKRITGEEKVLIYIGLYAVALLLFISSDSYLYDIHSKMDSAWFYMCGKSWMNGLIPYVDFTDSKGPLLWLIYGIGYLLSPTNFVGVFWITCLFYWMSFYLSYKTADIFLNDKGKSLLCSFLMGLAFFNPWFHTEIRSEDFSHLFLELSMYQLLLLVYKDDGIQYIKKRFLIFGLCFSALVLIKYNLALIQALLVLCALIVTWKRRGGASPILYGGIGIIGGFLPFLIYFLIDGNLKDFIQEYFVNTLLTVSGAIESPDNLILTNLPIKAFPFTYLAEWAGIIYTPAIGALFILLLIGGLLMMTCLDKNRGLPLIICLLFFAVSIRHAFYYYFCACAPCLVFLFTGLASKFSTPSNRVLSVAAILLILCISTIHISSFGFKTIFFNDNQARKDYYAVTAYLNQVEKPTLINAFWAETGLGTSSMALPAGRYWSRQVGETEQMHNAHEALILSGIADFIVINNRNTFEEAGNLKLADLYSIGYKECLRFGEKKESMLLSKHPMKDPSLIRMTPLDVLLKREPQISYTPSTQLQPNPAF